MGSIEKNSDELITNYYNNFDQHSENISQKNEEIFKNSEPIYLIKDLSINELWTDDISDITKESIWKYLNTLTLLASSYIKKIDLGDILKNENNETNENFNNLD